MHNIQERDSQHGLFMAWHGLTQIPEDGVLKKQEVFNYEMIKEPLYMGGEEYGDWYAPICSDDKLPIGKGVCLNESTYSLLTPHDVWGLVDELMEGTKHEIVSAGTVANRSRYFITLKLNELDSLLVGDREFDIYLNAISSMDRSIPLVITNTSICTVCENTLLANFNADSLFKHKLKHTHNLKQNIEAMKDLLDDTFACSAQFYKYMNELESMPCNEDFAERILFGELASERAEKDLEGSPRMATRLRNTVDEYLTAFKEGLGNQGETMLDLLSAFTQVNTRTDDTDPQKVAKCIRRDYDIRETGLPVKKARFAFSLLDSNKRTALYKRGNLLLDIMPV